MCSSCEVVLYFNISWLEAWNWELINLHLHHECNLTMILNKSFKLFSFLFLSLVLLKFDVHWKLFIFRYLVHSGRHDVRDHSSMILILTTFQVRTTVLSVVEVSCLIISKRKLFEISFVWPKKVILEKINMMSYCHHLVSVVFNLLLFLWNHRIWEFEFEFLCLTSLSSIFQLYHGDQF